MDIIIYGNDKIIKLIVASENSIPQNPQEAMEQIKLIFAKTDDEKQDKKLLQSASKFAVDESGAYNRACLNACSYKKDAVYKHSFYNIHFDNPKRHIIYNTLYNTLVRLNDDEYSEFNFKGSSCEALKESFVSNGLWIEEGLDERAHYLKLAELVKKVQLHSYSITIATTMECNARCPYCYEIGADHSPMANDVKSELLSFLDNLDLKNGVNITWIGGEPLLNTQLIDEVSGYLTGLDIPFTAYIITNGSLITDEIVEKMKTKWKVSGIQVTLDGIGKVYEERKKYTSKKEYFKEILHNIVKTGKQGINVDIRINIDRENRDNCVTLVEILGDYYADINNVYYYPAFIAGTDNPLTDDEKVDLISEMFEAGACANKFTVNNKLHSSPGVSPCMICDAYNIAIDTKGYVYKCDHFLGRPKNAVGKIDERKKVFKTMELCLSDECNNCKFLPKCFGGCTSDRNGGDRACFISRYLITAYLKNL